MEREPKKESAEGVVKRFIEFTKNGAEGIAGGVFWDTEMSKIFGDKEMHRWTGDDEFREKPDFENELVSAYKAEGLSGMKAFFLEKLYQTTDASKIGNSRGILKQIIDFE